MFLPKLHGRPLSILILEDDPSRIRKFRITLQRHQLVVCTTAEAAWNALENTPVEAAFEMMFIDHDLDITHYDVPAVVMTDDEKYAQWQRTGTFSVKTGYHFAQLVAKAIATNRPHYQVPTVIHSLNPAGSRAINAALPHAMRVPFSELIPLLTGTHPDA